MPRPPKVDREAIRAALDRCPSASAAARELGVSVNTVLHAQRSFNGLCEGCKAPVSGGLRLCDPCRRKEADKKSLLRRDRVATGTCVVCGLPVDPPSTQHCATHRAMRSVDARRQRKRNRATRPDEYQRLVNEWARRQLYGDAGVRVWNRTQGACQICGQSYRKRMSHIHHIDGDKSNNTEQNLIVACRNCHNLLHQIQWHPNLEAFLPWFRRTYPGVAF